MAIRRGMASIRNVILTVPSPNGSYGENVQQLAAEALILVPERATTLRRLVLVKTATCPKLRMMRCATRWNVQHRYTVTGVRGAPSEHALSPAEAEPESDLVIATCHGLCMVATIALQIKQKLKCATRMTVRFQSTAIGANGASGAHAVSRAQMEPTRDLDRATILLLIMVATLVPMWTHPRRVEFATMALARHQSTVTGALGAIGESVAKNAELAPSRDRELATILSLSMAVPIVSCQQTWLQTME